MDVDGFQLSVECGGQKGLRQSGILIPARWGPFSEEELTETGKMRDISTEKMVSGHILLDTGAGPIGIDLDVANELGLKPIGEKKELHGIAGRAHLDAYWARLILNVKPVKNGKCIDDALLMGLPQMAWGLPDIKKEPLGICRTRTTSTNHRCNRSPR